MIVRIIGEGQFELGEEHLAELNQQDAALAAAIDADDTLLFEQNLSRLLDRVRGMGMSVPAKHIAVSDFILPGPDSSLREVKELLGDEGLIPG